MVLEGYLHGLFPMPIEEGIGWFSPVERGVLPLDQLRISRSLRKSARRYRVSVDEAFVSVVAGCADPARQHGWIDTEVIATYTELHRLGAAHSVECWTSDGELAGGLYGIAAGGLFAGESMFHDPAIGRDASKVALCHLVARLRSAGGERVLDVQWQTPHLASLGVVELDRDSYLARLEQCLATPMPDWRTWQAEGRVVPELPEGHPDEE